MEEEEEEEDGRGRVLLSPRETEKGSRPSRDRAGQLLGEGAVSAATVLSKAARKGSPAGTCVPHHSAAVGADVLWANAGKRTAGESTSSGPQGVWDGAGHASGGSVWGACPGEGSRKADRKGSASRPRVWLASLL